MKKKLETKLMMRNFYADAREVACKAKGGDKSLDSARKRARN